MHSSLRTNISQWLARPTAGFAIRYVPQSLCFIGTTKGRVRADNQDKAVAVIFNGDRPASSFRAYVVCDGLGGMQDGERCAAEATAAFLSHLVSTANVTDRKSRLQRAIDFASREIFNEFQERGGTTIAAVLVTDTGATAVAVGDTRIYKQHGERGEITQLTVDDTIAARLAELKESAAPRVAQGPFGNHLTQFIGQSGQIVSQMVDSDTLLKDSDQSPRTGLLITTDGAHRMGGQTFDALARGASSAREMINHLISVSDWLGGEDNATAMYISLANQLKGQLPSKPALLALNNQFNQLGGELWSLIESCLNSDAASRPSADDLVAACGTLCYSRAPRCIGTIYRYGGNPGTWGFVNCSGSGGDAFFHSASFWGDKPQVGARVSLAKFPGSPSPRAHPVLLLRPE